MGDRSAIVTNEWIKRFNDYLDEKPGGRDAWSNLGFGSNVALLMLLAAQITSDLYCPLTEQRKKLRRFSKDLKVGSRQILSTAQLVTKLSNEFFDRGVDLKQYAQVPGQLRAYAGDMAGFAKVLDTLSTARLPKTADFALYFLHAYLDGATGQPQWRGLATLLEAAHSGHGHCVEVDEECLRKRIERMRTDAKHAPICLRLEEMVREYLASGNGNWLSKQELNQMAIDFVALELSKDA